MSEVRGKKYLLAVATLTFLVGMVLMSAPVKAEDPYVRVYVDQPQGYLPFVTPGDKFTFDVLIETSGFSDGTVGGIIQWGIESFCVDPEVLDIDTTVSGFPPSYAAKFSTGADHFLYEFANIMGYPAPSLFLGTNDPSIGCQYDISETGIPSYATGAGDYCSATWPSLLTVELTSLSNTQSCVINMTGVKYRTGDGVWHDPDLVEDVYYGPQPTPEFPLGAVVQVGLIAAVAYVWWTRRHKLKEVP